MKVTTYGTRGSIPVSGPQYERYGGNTTCLRILSECLPKKTALMVDAGSGFLPASREAWSECPHLALLLTHYHHDHTQGFPMAMHTHHPASEITVWGPVEYREGPENQLAHIMRPPQFPVPLEKVKDRITCKKLDVVGTEILVVHPSGGFALVKLDTFVKAERNGTQIGVGRRHYDIRECLVIKMLRTEHPERTVSYRFEERPTGKVFVFLTDHENTAGWSKDLLGHLRDADLLIQDGQYSEEEYADRTTGFGHGTPQYCMETAWKAGAKVLGLTHHDPNASDKDVDARVEDARLHGIEIGAEELAKTVFACADNMTLTV